MPKLHEVKTWAEYFEAVWDGRKPFELRKDDRGYEVGDRLRQWEYDRETGFMTGRWTESEISYIVREAPHFGLMPGFAILGVPDLDCGWDDRARTEAARDRMKSPNPAEC